jgi:hypothetical protein
MKLNYFRLIFNKVIAPLSNIIVYPFVFKKWEEDSKSLPLKPEHRDLYFIIHQHMFRKLLRFPNLKDCQDFNDKIQWLKLFDQDEKKILCSDKLGVREFASSRIADKHLVPLYQVVNSFEQIDFDSLPSSFVLKTNHDSGSVILVREKDDLDIKKAKKFLDKSLNQKYGCQVGEWAYSLIKPKILVEFFIDPDGLAPPPDFKFYCVNGKVKFCHYIYDRGHKPKEQLITPDGKDIGVPLHPKFPLGDAFILPVNWNEMIKIAEKLSIGFKCVRVDLFSAAKGEIYLGEMTFWPQAGTYRGHGQRFHGKELDFDRESFFDPVCNNKQSSN